ncbi:MAG: FimV/HubP family polar landmark protein [Gallionella sp.]
MKKSLLNLLGVAALSYSVHAYSAGVGGINVGSALGQPLKADIELFASDKAEKSSIVARLATPEAYKSRGLDYPFGNKFKFVIENHADGESVIHVSSNQPVNDPFVSLLVDVNWASGKLVREFTFLLDPPGYQPEPLPAIAVDAVAPAVELSEPVVVAAPVVAAEPAATEAAVPVTAEAVEAVSVTPLEKTPATKTATSKHAAPAEIASDGEIKVQRGDSLHKLAEQNAIDGVSLERMMVALYRANAKQFDGKNMNRIKTGKILRMPDAAELAAVSAADASKEIRAQVKDWNAYRQQLANVAPMSVAAAPAQVSSGKVHSVVADKTPVTKDNAKEVLKLSKGLAPEDKVVSAGKAASTQEQKNAAQEEQIAKAKAAEEQRGRAALLEKNLKEIQHLAELKTQAATILPASAVKPVSAVASVAPVSAASAVASVSGVVAASSVAAASGVVAASAVAAVPPKLKPAPVELTLIEKLLAEPLYLAGGLAALLALIGGAFVAKRRKSNTTPDTFTSDFSDIGSATGRISVPEIASPDNGDFTKTLVTSDSASASLKEDDPISEADLFLSFGRDAQAEEILQEALQSNPNNEAVKLKLLEIFAKGQNKSSFEKIAKTLQSSANEQAWQRAQAMGKKLDPKNTLYGAVVEDADSATMQTLSMKNGLDANPKTVNQKVDFDITGGAKAMADADKTMIFSAADMASAQKAVMDFDVTGTNPSLAVSSMDFDVTAAHPTGSEPAASLSDMIFDVTATHPSMPATNFAAEVKSPPADDGLAFSLDFPIDIPAAPVVKPVEFNLSDISFDLNDAPAASTVSPASDFNEVATKLDLAKAYQEMGDVVGAREILDEVMREGSAEQRDTAQMLISQLG